MNYYMNNDRNRVKRGEIYYIAHAKCYATDPSNAAGRPGVIVSSDGLNKHSDSVEVVYLTSQEKKPMPTHAEVLCKTPSTALCETVYTISKDRLGDFVRCCTDKEMETINGCLLHSLGIIPSAVKVEREESEPVETPVMVERNLYKTLYEDLLNKVMAR